MPIFYRFRDITIY